MEGSAILSLAAALLHHINGTKGSDGANRSSFDEVSSERGLRAGDGLTSLCKVDEQFGHLLINICTFLVVLHHAVHVPILPGVIAVLVFRDVIVGIPVETFSFRSFCFERNSVCLVCLAFDFFQG